jgi:hypothetical protein
VQHHNSREPERFLFFGDFYANRCVIFRAAVCQSSKALEQFYLTCCQRVGKSRISTDASDVLIPEHCCEQVHRRLMPGVPFLHFHVGVETADKQKWGKQDLSAGESSPWPVAKGTDEVTTRLLKAVHDAREVCLFTYVPLCAARLLAPCEFCVPSKLALIVSISVGRLWGRRRGRG